MKIAHGTDENYAALIEAILVKDPRQASATKILSKYGLLTTDADKGNENVDLINDEIERRGILRPATGQGKGKITPYYVDLFNEFFDKGYAVSEIAQAFKVGSSSVRKYIVDYDIKKQGKGHPVRKQGSES